VVADPRAFYADPNQDFSKNRILDPDPDSFGFLLCVLLLSIKMKNVNSETF
jgi:hypothetical protein